MMTERMDREARIRERVRDLLDEIVSVELHPINHDPYPASVGEVADEIARYVLELEAPGSVRLMAEVRARLREMMDERGHLDADKIERLEGAPEIEARHDSKFCVLCRSGEHKP